MRTFNTIVSWIQRQKDNWLLMEPALYKKRNGAYPDTLGGLAVRVNSLMIKNQYFRDPDLTIDKFCEQAEVNRCYLSRAINRVYGVSFTSWVNMFRIEEAKRILKGCQEKIVNMEDVAIRCGYNSARSFIRVFASREDCTPKQYHRRENKRLTK